MLQTKVDALDGLESGVLPITPLTKTFSVVTASSKKITVTCQQLPITPAYAFTDYRSQVQTIDHCIMDLATPLSGQLTPFNTYVALSQSRGRNGIHLLRDFGERLFTYHPSEHLRREDTRLNQLDDETKKRWEVFQAECWEQGDVSAPVSKGEHTGTRLSGDGTVPGTFRGKRRRATKTTLGRGVGRRATTTVSSQLLSGACDTTPASPRRAKVLALVLVLCSSFVLFI